MRYSWSALSAMVAVAGLAQADVLISNLPAPAGGGTFLSPAFLKEAAFRVPTGAGFRFTSATLRVTTPSTDNQPRVELWQGNASNALTFVARLETGTIPAIAPFDLVCEARSPVELERGGIYWIRVTATAGSFSWTGTADVVPTGVMTHVTYVNQGLPSATENYYSVEGEIVEHCIDFDRTPGSDGVIGNFDDLLIVAPTTFGAQAGQQTTQWAVQGVDFRPQPPVQDANEILNDDTFGPNPGSGVNILTSSSAGGGTITAVFTRPVYSVSLIAGIAGGLSDIVEIFDQSGALIDSAVGDSTRVVLRSNRPIGRMVVRGSVGLGIPAIDDLCMRFALPLSCEADFSGSSDPNSPLYGVPDGIVDASDFFYYLDRFVEGCP